MGKGRRGLWGRFRALKLSAPPKPKCTLKRWGSPGQVGVTGWKRGMGEDEARTRGGVATPGRGPDPLCSASQESKLWGEDVHEGVPPMFGAQGSFPGAAIRRAPAVPPFQVGTGPAHLLRFPYNSLLLESCLGPAPRDLHQAAGFSQRRKGMEEILAVSLVGHEGNGITGHG